MIERRESKLEGKWRIVKAKFDHDRKLFNEDVLDDFKADLVEFFPDYTLIYDQYSNKERYYGNWFIEADKYFDGEDDVTDFYIVIDLFDADDNFLESFEWKINSLTKNKLNVEEYVDDGFYIFRLEKI
jgi:hypothetical protein